MPGVLLISIDTLRADHVGCYGYHRPTTPVLDRLAEEGIRFARMYSVSSWTLPAHMSLMTSRYPHGHKVERSDRALAPMIPTLAQALSERGMRTGAIISWFYVSARFGFDRGFDDFIELLPEREELAASYKAADVVDRASAWLRRVARQRKPFFLFVHLFDPHLHYSPPPPFDRKFASETGGLVDGTYDSLSPYIKGLHAEPARISPQDLEQAVALYDGEISYTDTEIGRLLDLLDQLSLEDSTLVIVTSDHGEEHDDHGSMEGHQWTLYDEILHVPMIARLPGGPRGKVVDAMAEIIDVAPTVLDWLGLQLTPGFRGRSLLPLAAGEEAGGERLVYSKTERFNSKQAVRSAAHKLIHTVDIGMNSFGVPVEPGYELYDLRSDPREQKNIYSESSAVAQDLKKALLHWLATREPAEPGEEVEFTEKEKKRLRSLGYLR